MESSGSDLTASIASAAVQVLLEVATGTATGVGQAVGDLVRARLGGSEHSRAALDGVAAAPADPAAADNLRSVLQSALADDPEFMTSLVGALAGSPASVPPATTGSMVFGHSTVRGANNFSLGNQSISNRRTSHGWLTAAAVLVGVALVGLGLYAGLRFGEGDKPQAEPGTTTGEVVAGGQAVKAVRDRELATKILPDMDSVPTGWVLDKGFPAEGKCPPGCQGSLVSVKTAYYPGGTADWVWMEVHTFGSVEAARTGYSAMKQRLATTPEEHKIKLHPEPTPSTSEYPTTRQSPISLQGLGADEYEAISWSVIPGRGLTSGTGVAVVGRAGTVVADVGLIDKGAGGSSSTLLQALTRAVVERAWQAQRGETPTALVRHR